VCRGRLLARIVEMRIVSNLVPWVGSFMDHCRVRMVTDGCERAERGVQTGIPQGSPVWLILFSIYHLGDVEAVETLDQGAQALFFVDHVSCSLDCRRYGAA
jgi:hypothetical protein